MPTARAFLSVLLLPLLGALAIRPSADPQPFSDQTRATPAGRPPAGLVASATVPWNAPGSRGVALACSAVSGKETISPCTASGGILRPGTSGTQSFVVWNRTIEDDAFSLSCTRSGAIAQCSPSSSSLIVRAGTFGTFTVTFTAGADGGSGTANVTAAGLGTLTATISASVNPIQVTPRDSVITRGPSTVYTQNFTVRNLGNTQKTINLAKVCDATLGCTLTTGTPVTLAGNATTTATVQYTTGPIGSSYPVRLAATASTQPSWTDTGSVVLSIPNPLAPTVSSAPQNGHNRLAGLCAVGCFETRASYGTPAYTSMDTPRSLALVYSSAQARPMAVVQVVAQDRSARPAQVMSLSLLRPNNSLVDFTNGKRELFFATADSLPKRLAGQFDATGLATGIYRYTAVVTSYWTSGPDAGTTMQTSVPVAVLVVNERASAYGAGWSIAGLARLYTPDTMTTAIADGAGSLTVYTKQNGVWAAPAGDFGRLDPVLSGSIVVGWTRVSPAGVVDSFSATGYLLATRDRFGNRSSYGYDASNRLQTVVDPAGKVLTLAYTGGKLDTITDPGGRVSHFAVNGTSGDLTSITDPTGTVTFQGAYDTEHRLTQATDRRGGTWLYRYDFAGKLASDSTPLVRVDGTTKRVGTRYRSLEAAILIDPATTVGDSITRPAPRVWSDSVRALVVAPTGDSTRYALDAYGAPTRIERPLLRTVTTITRDAASHVTKTVTAVRGQTVQSDTAVWDGPRLVTQTDQTSGMSVTYAYDPTYSLVTSVSGSTQRIVNYLSADKKRVDSARVGSIANDSTIRYSYDSRGRVTKIKDQLRDSTVFTFDTAGYQNTFTVTQGTRVTRYRYDGYGRLVRTVNPRGDSVVVSLDSLNRTRNEAGPNGAQVSYGYDALFLRTITDAKGQTYTYARNALGWLDTLTHANTADPLASRQERWEYAATGVVTAHVNRRGQQTSFTYDAQGRLRTRTLPGGQTTTFDYDTAGYWSTVSNGESTDTVLVTPSGTGTVAKEITWRGGARYVVRRTTDTQGLVRSRVLTQGTDTASLFKVSYGYDAARRLDTLLIGGKRTRLTYNADGVLRSLKLPTGDSLTIGITGAHRPYTVTYNRSALNKPFGGNYTLDTLDRIVKRSAVGGDSTWTYAYDALGQLTSYTRYYNSVAETCVPDPSYMDGMRCTTTATPTLVSTSTFTYDTVGNRTDLGTALAGGNRLVKFNGDSLVYDADGNLVKRFRSGQEVQRLYWNSIGQLVAVWTSGADSVTFGYDGWGRRVRKTTAVQSLRYIYAGQQVLTRSMR